jgi:N-hydroxyarylamine O-acetyltransferase
MCVLVQLGQPYLADVGYGDLFRTPLPLVSGDHWDGHHFFRLEAREHQEWLLSMSDDGQIYKPRYLLSLGTVAPEDFNDICQRKQTDPESYFVKNLVCTRPTPNGRKTIFNHQLIVTEGKCKVTTPIEDESRLDELLAEHFGIL